MRATRAWLSRLSFLTLPEHLSPWWAIPWSIEPQWSQKVGVRYVNTSHLCFWLAWEQEIETRKSPVLHLQSDLIAWEDRRWRRSISQKVGREFSFGGEKSIKPILFATSPCPLSISFSFFLCNFFPPIQKPKWGRSKQGEVYTCTWTTWWWT